MRRVIAFALALICCAICAQADEIVWAHGATHFGHECPNDAAACVIAKVASPDRIKTFVVRRCSTGFRFEVSAGAKRFEVHPASDMSPDFEAPYVEMEVLWAPDSSAFPLAWNETAITDRSEVYVALPDSVRRVDLRSVKEGFATRFPPCAGDPEPCRVDKAGLFYNYLAIGWAAPHTVVLMAEVPPSSSWGRNMGKVNGYEVDALTGRVVRVLTPAEFKRRWQSHLGWDFNVRDAE